MVTEHISVWCGFSDQMTNAYLNWVGLEDVIFFCCSPLSWEGMFLFFVTNYKDQYLLCHLCTFDNITPAIRVSYLFTIKRSLQLSCAEQWLTSVTSESRWPSTSGRLIPSLGVRFPWHLRAFIHQCNHDFHQYIKRISLTSARHRMAPFL